MKTLTAKRLREVLEYDAATGIFRWRVARGRGVKPGDVAGTVKKNGYRHISIDWRQYRANRLAWLYVHGHWPNGQIDHKNVIPGDDRFENLRDATHAGNQQNQRQAHSNNKLGMLGVSKRRRKYRARISVNGKERCLGFFSTPEEAHAAYIAAKRQVHATCTL